jgi:putative ABC transport system ATP-binding protein
MIECHNIKFLYPQSTIRLSIPHFHLEKKQWGLLKGYSGSGKTTFLHLISGILKPQEGKIRVSDVEITQARPSFLRNFRISKIGFVFQNFELLEYLTVEQNICYPFYLNPTLKFTEEHSKDLQQLLGEMGIGDKTKNYPRELSQGEQQRVCVARALITRPALLLADEPTGNLDPESTLKVMQLLQHLCKPRETTVLIVSHDQSLFSYFDKIWDAKEWRVSHAI